MKISTKSRPGMREFEVFEKRVEIHTVERAPGASQVLASFCLLPSIVVEQKLKKEDLALVRRSPINSLSQVTLSLIWKPVVKQFIHAVNAIKGCTSMLCTSVLFRM
jgi:hypothetical protein